MSSGLPGNPSKKGALFGVPKWTPFGGSGPDLAAREIVPCKSGAIWSELFRSFQDRKRAFWK